MVRAAFFGRNRDSLKQVYGEANWQRIAECCDIHWPVVTAENFNEQLPRLAELEVIFSSWGMFPLTEEHLNAMPKLKAVFYAAGSVKGFAVPLLQRGVTVVSAWGANAVPVAEFALAQILLANKGYFRNIRDCADPETRRRAFRGVGNFGETVAILGAGMVGRTLIEFLKPFQLHAIVFDPFLTAGQASELGVGKVTLNDAFKRGRVVTNHLASVPETQGLLRGEHFASMRQSAVFINAGRGATVAENDLIDVLRERPDLTALLDVTHPEPPRPDSPLYELPNVFLSSHIAGAIGPERARLGNAMLEEFTSWLQGKPLRYAVTLDMLKTMA